MAYPIYYKGAWQDAEKVTVSIKDVGFLRGFGIFDFFRIMDGKPIFMSDHLDRFLSSASKMGLPHRYSKESLATLITEIAAKSVDPCLGVKLVLTAGFSPNGFDPSGDSELYIFPGVFSFAEPSSGLRLISREYKREMADIKSLNYAFALREMPAVRAAGGDDLIYYTSEFGVSESSRSNLFYVKNGVIHTPAHHILEGITRKKVIVLASSVFEVRVGPCSLEDFLQADEVFTTGSTKRVLPIFSIDGKQIGDGKRGEVTSAVYELLISSEA
jgi:D-alanine transaminase/branched-chain amino acid aminotransferase